MKKINFTGSTTVGRVIATLAGKNVKPVLMELGGKASTLVFPGADLRQAAIACARGSFIHAGQICMACERIVVQSTIADAFVAELRTAMDETFGSSGHDGSTQQLLMGSMAGVQKTKQLVRQALQAGAVPLIGSEGEAEPTGGDSRRTPRMAPVVLKGVTKEMDIYYMESFGPVVSLITVDSEEEAVVVANDTEYGLSAAVFTSNLQQGLRVAKKIESG